MIEWLSEVFILLMIIFASFTFGVAFGQDSVQGRRKFK